MGEAKRRGTYEQRKKQAEQYKELMKAASKTLESTVKEYFEKKQAKK